MDWIAHTTGALFSTYRGASKLPDDILAVEGYSSPLVRRLLNNLCDFGGCRYVEVGTWQGATALSASYLNRGSFKAIDNFSEFGGPSCATTSLPCGTCTRAGIARWTAGGTGYSWRLFRVRTGRSGRGVVSILIPLA
jgi:hypothetical protein